MDFWKTGSTTFLPYEIFIAMRNISPRDLEDSLDGQSIQEAMTLDLQCQSFRNSMHGDFTLIAQLFGKKINLPLPAGIPSSYGHGIFCDDSVLGELKCIRPAEYNYHAVRDGVWVIEAYQGGCWGVLIILPLLKCFANGYVKQWLKVKLCYKNLEVPRILSTKV
jgi:hypothetical protein